MTRERYPYRWWQVHNWVWFIREPGHVCHRMFWSWQTIDGPIVWIYYWGVFAVCWDECQGWYWGGWNFD